MNQRKTMRLCGFLSVLVVVLAAETAHAAEKRNVLFIVSDDLNNNLGCYGAPVQSPNLDRLASRGVKFERAYCQFPLCGPSRSSFMSGLRPNTTGVLTNGPDVRFKLKDVVTLPQLFRNNGYFSARVGKIYHLGIPGQVGTAGPDDPQSWDHTFNPKGNEFPTADDGEMADPNPRDGQSFRYNILRSDGDDQHDHQAADEAIRILREKKGEPFFLALGLIRPHVPLPAPRKYFEMYPMEGIKLPHVPENDRDDIPELAFVKAKEVHRNMTEQQRRESIRAYNACISFMDAQVGRVLDELEKLGLSENTVIVFIGDHGYALGEHHAWQKMMLFEPVARIPMIIAAPGMKPAATRALAEAIDLYPTVAELCGLQPPARMDGKSQVPVLKDPSAKVKTAAFTQVRRGANAQGRSVRTDRFRYTEWFADDGTIAAELYDEEADPGEFTNLASDPKHAETARELKKLLAAALNAAAAGQ